MYTECVNARRIPAVFAAAALVLAIPPVGHAAGPNGNGWQKAHTPHKIVRQATSTFQGGYQPNQVAVAYGLASLGCYGTVTCGAGQTIAIVDAYDNPTIESDLAAFDAQFGLPCDNCFQKLTPQGTPTADAGWALEEALDVEWAHALAPGAKIVLVEATSASLSSLLGAVSSAVSSGANVVSMSWGTSEFSLETFFDSYFSAANVSFFASSGDSGPGVIWPAAVPTVTAVGGTTLPLDATGALTGDETAWSGSGGGVSAYEPNRSVPDVAFVGDPATGVAVYDTTPYNGESGWFVIGGTSVGAPAWAALAATIDAQRATPLGNANPALYALPSTDFRDVTSPAPATPGYDTATGLGAPLVDLLVPALAPPPPSGSLSFTTAPQTLTAGAASAAITVQATGDTTVTFASNAATGTFATAPGGPWSSTVSVSGSTATVYYRDTKAGSPKLTASASGFASATQAETVTAAALATLTVTPGTASLGVGATQSYRAAGTDAFGNAVAVAPAWSVAPALGSFAPTSGATTTFTASATGTGTVTATTGGVTATSTLSVSTAKTLRAASITYRTANPFGILYITVFVVDGNGTPVANVAVNVTTYRNNFLFATGSGATNSSGNDLFTAYFTPAGCYTTKVTKLALAGYTWNGVTPPNQFCK